MDLTAAYNEFLVRPLFNILILIYNNFAQGNFGYAIILFTIGLRVVLLPLSIISEASSMRYKEFANEAEMLGKSFKGDRIALKEEMRRLAKKYRLRPWAKTAALAVQAAVLVVLYQVFKVSIRNGVIVSSLYSWVDVPGKLNLNFWGFDIGERNFWWALAVGIILFGQIIKTEKGKFENRKEMWFAVLFPFVSVLVLWALPMVKSLFILTSMVFSYILFLAGLLILKIKNSGGHGHGTQEGHGQEIHDAHGSGGHHH